MDGSDASDGFWCPQCLWGVSHLSPSSGTALLHLLGGPTFPCSRSWVYASCSSLAGVLCLGLFPLVPWSVGGLACADQTQLLQKEGQLDHLMSSLERSHSQDLVWAPRMPDHS